MSKRDVKVGAVSAALSALAFVAVYEGKVAVSHASERIELGAGESARAGRDGVKATGTLADGQREFEAKVAAENEPFAKANENLVAQVGEYRQRLEAIAAQKSDLEAKLKKSEEKLAATQDGASPRTRSEWDLDSNDWSELAKEGKVKYRMPCPNSQSWDLSPEKLNKLGLAPTDAPAIRDAYEKSNQRVWAVIKPMCVQALGASPEIVEKIGLQTCPHLIYDIALSGDAEAARDAHTIAAEIRAGIRPEPGPNDKVHPITKMFLALTGTNKGFEGDLAKSFGPEEAHRLAYSEDMCTSNHSWGGGRKRDR